MKKIALPQVLNIHLSLLCLFLFLGMSKGIAQDPPPYISFQFEIVGPEVSFTPYSNVEILSYAWEFGDGSESMEEESTHFYTTPGLHLVELRVTYQGPQTVEQLTATRVIRVADFGNISHEDRAFKKNSINNSISVVEEALINNFSSIELIHEPFEGMASVDADHIIYTPNTDYLGFDIIEYKVNFTNGESHTSYVYIDVYEGCGFELSLTSSWSHCPEACDNGTISQPFGQPFPDNCWGYTFDLYNVGDETIRSVTANIEIDEEMGLNIHSGSVELVSTLDEELFNIVFDDINQKVTINLKPGQEIPPHSRFQYSFTVNVGGELEIDKSYHTDFDASVACEDGTQKVFDQTVIDYQGGACDPNLISVSPQGCGGEGAVGEEVDYLTYTVEFENEGFGPASRVVIADILPAGLDATTVRVIDGEPSLPQLQIIPPENRVEFIFGDIHLPPSSEDSIHSAGYVKFRVDLDHTLADGTSLDNYADVFFDQQFPVRTDTTTTTFRNNPTPVFTLGPDVVDTDSLDGFDCIPFNVMVTGGSGQYDYEWEISGDILSGFDVSVLTICPLQYIYIDLNVTDIATGCEGHDRLYVSPEEPETLVSLPGDSCAISNDINNLFGQAVGEPQTSSLWDNTNYTDVSGDPTTGMDCFFDNQNLRGIWYTFTGDGNRYRIKTVRCNATNYVGGEGDTQMAIYTGGCTELTPFLCNEDEDLNLSLNHAFAEFDTEPNVEYHILIDGTSFVTIGEGEFCIEVSQLMVSDLTEIEQQNINIYPNPSTGFLNLQGADIDFIELVDIHGRLLKRQTTGNNSLDITDLPAGMYFLKLGVEEEVIMKQVVKE